MAKTIDQHFADWENHVFGHGYGTGEEHVIAPLKWFLRIANTGGTYDFTRLESKVRPDVTWLLINILAKTDIIEYGTSPRFGWLTEEGKSLANYLGQKHLFDVLDIIKKTETMYCTPEYCNCDDEPCQNPFWVNVKDREFING